MPGAIFSATSPSMSLWDKLLTILELKENTAHLTQIYSWNTFQARCLYVLSYKSEQVMIWKHLHVYGNLLFYFIPFFFSVLVFRLH